MIRTAVIILNWNGIGFLKKFLPSVVNLSLNRDTEIYIADNGSTDGSAEWVDENFRDIRLIRLERNLGFSAGYNSAIEKIDAQYYVLLNSDIEVTQGWLDPLISCLEENPVVASCQPKILSYRRKDHFEYAGAAGGFIDKYGYPLCRGRVITEVEKDKGQYDTPADIFWSTGACMAVRSEAWKKCGGFDPDFFAHMEEIDLCWRFHRAGYRVRFVPGSVVYHVGGGSLPYNSPFKTFLNFRNSLFLLYKNLPQKNFRRKMLIRMILDGVAAVFFLSKGQFRSVISVWNAHMGFYKRLKKLKVERVNVKTLGCNEPAELILNKCIVFEFYIRGRKTFQSLMTKPLMK
jgi:GT2 family glycosyltransferase